jgi:hypothetical protein
VAAGMICGGKAQLCWIIKLTNGNQAFKNWREAVLGGKIFISHIW